MLTSTRVTAFAAGALFEPDEAEEAVERQRVGPEGEPRPPSEPSDESARKSNVIACACAFFELADAARRAAPSRSSRIVAAKGAFFGTAARTAPAHSKGDARMREQP
eukprot:5374888-Pleurochrysis_carterae.AAC.3